MSFLEDLQKEIDRAGAAAKSAFDEGKLRLDLYRVRRLADEAAEALGYAVHRARREGNALDAETMTRLDGTLREHATEAERIEQALADIRMPCGADDAATESAAAAAPAGSAAPPNGDAATPTG